MLCLMKRKMMCMVHDGDGGDVSFSSVTHVPYRGGNTCDCNEV